MMMSFFCNDTATTEIYTDGHTLSLHDALPIFAHDFNNLLTGISGALEMLDLRLSQGRVDDLARYIGVAQTATARAAALTHRLLAFSRRQPLDPHPINIARLIADMEDLVRRTVGPSILVEIVHPADLWPVLADGNQLENALLNLVINARDAMPSGGQLTIRTACAHFGGKRSEEHTSELPSLMRHSYAVFCLKKKKKKQKNISQE